MPFSADRFQPAQDGHDTRTRAAGGSVALALAIFAVFASGLAILAALAPSAFQDLLRPVLG